MRKILHLTQSAQRQTLCRAGSHAWPLLLLLLAALLWVSRHLAAMSLLLACQRCGSRWLHASSPDSTQPKFTQAGISAVLSPQRSCRRTTGQRSGASPLRYPEPAVFLLHWLFAKCPMCPHKALRTMSSVSVGWSWPADMSQGPFSHPEESETLLEVSSVLCHVSKEADDS